MAKRQTKLTTNDKAISGPPGIAYEQAARGKAEWQADQGDEPDFDFSGKGDADDDDPEWQKDASEYPGIPTDDDFPLIAKLDEERALECLEMRDPNA